MERLEPCSLPAGEYNVSAAVENIGRLLKDLPLKLACKSAVQLLDVYTKGLKAGT